MISPCSMSRSTARLRGCDVVARKLEDLHRTAMLVDRAIVWQTKTRRPDEIRVDGSDPRGRRRISQDFEVGSSIDDGCPGQPCLERSHK
jgi:hypothetical protein